MYVRILTRMQKKSPCASRDNKYLRRVSIHAFFTNRSLIELFIFMVNHGEDVAYYALVNKAFHQTCGPNGRIWHQLCQLELGMRPPCCHSLYTKYVHTWDPNMRDRGSVRVVPSHPRIIVATEKGGPFFLDSALMWVNHFILR